MITIPAGVLPVQDLATEDILYGARTTSFRYELLSHNSSTGVDTLLGYLDGVQPGGSLTWDASQSVKKSGGINVLDLETASPGMIRIADVNLLTTRIRPVLVIEGLPDIQLSVYVVTAAPEQWNNTGRIFALELHDKSTVLDQDPVAATYTVASTTPVLTAIAAVISSSGETIAVDASDARTLPASLAWAAGTSKLKIVNDLLASLNYNALWVDGAGSFRATPYTLPANRSALYTMLNDETGAALVRELSDGDQSIYAPDWSRDKDTFDVPNQVIAIQAAAGGTAPLTGSWTNTDPTSPFSYPSRGRWITTVLDSVEVPDYTADMDGGVARTTAFLQATAQASLIASSAVQAALSVKCLPIPIGLLEAVQFASTPAGINAVHTVQTVGVQLQFDGLMTLGLQEVLNL